MASLDAGEQDLSNEVSLIKIGKRYWYLRVYAYSIDEDAIENAKMVEIFGDA